MGKVHWRDRGLKAFVFQFFLSFSLISLSFEIVSETIPLSSNYIKIHPSFIAIFLFCIGQEYGCQYNRIRSRVGIRQLMR